MSDAANPFANDAANPFAGKWITPRGPSGLIVNIAKWEGRFALDAIFAEQEDAERLTSEHFAEYQRRLDQCREEARERFLRGPRWVAVQKLREHLAQLQSAAAAAETALAEMQQEFGLRIAEGDSLSLLPTIRQQKNEAEAARREVETLEPEIERLEHDAAQALRKAVYQALTWMAADARQQRIELVKKIAQSVDRSQLTEAALLESLASVQGHPSPAFGTVAVSEHDAFFQLPPREEITPPDSSPLEIEEIATAAKG